MVNGEIWVPDVDNLWSVRESWRDFLLARQPRIADTKTVGILYYTSIYKSPLNGLLHRNREVDHSGYRSFVC